MTDEPVSGQAFNDDLTDPINTVGLVAHELKTPVAAIKSYADLVEQTGDLNNKQVLYLQRIRRAVYNMSSLIDDLLDMVRLDRGGELQIGPCSIVDVIRTQKSYLEGLAQEHEVSIHLTYDDDIPLIDGDERLLGVMVANLLSNGIKYNQSKGNIWVNVYNESTHVRVTIKDEGIGIAAADLPNIFKSFYRAEQDSEHKISGSGLGLAISKAVVERHNGSIGVTSAPGQGSTFFFTLPCRMGA